MDFHPMTMTGRDLPENVNVIGLISNGFDDLGVLPVLGRGLVRADAIDGQEPQPVAVLSYRFWQNRFFSDPQVVGKTVELDRKKYAIVGVAAPQIHLVQRGCPPAAEAGAGPGEDLCRRYPPEAGGD
jgi:hypothetical protein